MFLAEQAILIYVGSSNTVEYNYFGTRDVLTVPGPWTFDEGIRIWSNANTFRHNLVVGYEGSEGVYILGSSNVVESNIVGTDKLGTSGLPLPNKIGIHVHQGINNFFQNNTIAGNKTHGIYLHSTASNTFFDNIIGGTEEVKNQGDGIHIGFSADTNSISGNIVSYNDGSGVYVSEGKGNIIQDNIFYGNEYGIYVSSGEETTIKKNTIWYNLKDGVYIADGYKTLIGDSESADANTISANQANGVHLDETGAFLVKVVGNYIGFAIGGDSIDVGNQGHGILVENGAYWNTIGGSKAGEANWIGFNHQDGVRLSGSNTHDNTIANNVIGAPPAWDLEAPNGHHGIGVYDGAHDNDIGFQGGGNTILASSWSGVAIVNSDSNTVHSNYIGTDGRSIHWGNSFYGINIVNGKNNNMFMNEIAYNGKHDAEAGVRVDGINSTGNYISLNSIHDNGGKGIELANGAHAGQAPPTINRVVRGEVEGTACTGCGIHIYSDREDEGRIFEGFVFADAATGAFLASGLSIAGPHVTATATKSNNTSEFSYPVQYKRVLPFLQLLLD